jgi:hypothetical protein
VCAVAVRDQATDLSPAPGEIDTDVRFRAESREAQPLLSFLFLQMSMRIAFEFPPHRSVRRLCDDRGMSFTNAISDAGEAPPRRRLERHGIV